MSHEVLLRESDIACQDALLKVIGEGIDCSLEDFCASSWSSIQLFADKGQLEARVSILSLMLAFCEATVTHFSANPLQPFLSGFELDENLHDDVRRLHSRFCVVREGWLRSCGTYILHCPSLRSYVLHPDIVTIANPSVVDAVREFADEKFKKLDKPAQLACLVEILGGNRKP